MICPRRSSAPWRRSGGSSTRAKKRLTLLTCVNRFGEPSPPSTFVEQFLGLPAWSSQKPKAEAAPRKEPSAAAVAAWEKDYLPGTAVVHRSFGPGVVESRAGSLAVIDFGEAGVRKVELAACLRRRLIRLASSPGF